MDKKITNIMPKIKTYIKQIKKKIKPIRSQRMAIRRALKSLIKEPLLFIKQKTIIQFLIISFKTDLSLTLEL